MNVKSRAALFSVGSNTVLVAMKAGVGISIGSVAVISEAIHSGLDLLAALIAFFAVRIAAHPPDAKHQYGHGKYENVSGTIEAILILVAAVWIIVEAVQQIMNPHLKEVGWGVVVMGVSAGANWFISVYLFRVARKTHSVALEADAMHLRTDVYTSVGVFVGLGLIKLTGWAWLDALSALLVAALIIKAAISLTMKAFTPLVDEALPASEVNIIREVLQKYCTAGEVLSFHKLRTRQSGPDRQVDVHLVCKGDMHLDIVHELTERIETEIRDKLQNVSVLIHMEPQDRKAEE